MQARLNFAQVPPDAVKAMLELEGFLARSRVEHSLIHLVKMRVSQINDQAAVAGET